jgi:hypothetical protein
MLTPEDDLFYKSEDHPDWQLLKTRHSYNKVRLVSFYNIFLALYSRGGEQDSEILPSHLLLRGLWQYLYV